MPCALDHGVTGRDNKAQISGSPAPCWGYSIRLGKDKAGAVGKQQGHASAMAGQGLGQACLGSDEVTGLGHAGDGICHHGQQALQVCWWHPLAQDSIYLICRITSREEIPG